MGTKLNVTQQFQVEVGADQVPPNRTSVSDAAFKITLVRRAHGSCIHVLGKSATGYASPRLPFRPILSCEAALLPRICASGTATFPVNLRLPSKSRATPWGFITTARERRRALTGGAAAIVLVDGWLVLAGESWLAAGAIAGFA